MSNLNRKILLQVFVWVSIYIFFFSMSNYFQPTIHSLWSSLIDTVSLLLLYLFITYYLFPKYFINEQKYLLFSLIIILVYTIILFEIDVFLVNPHRIHLEKRPPLIFPFMRNFIGVTLTYLVATFVCLIKHTNTLKENEKLLTEEKLKTELKLLKAQINPHFIFNALNNIYSLTYMKAKNAPDSVLKLSEMLRYVFYDCSKEKVHLLSEIKYIDNFIGFQQMKSDNKQNIKLKVDLKTKKEEIAPMLFIPFIENAFKYSRVEEVKNAYVNICISSKNGKLQFAIENSVDVDNKPMAGSGTGIKNVQHRLNIIYPDKHELIMSENKNKYSVELNIDL